MGKYIDAGKLIVTLFNLTMKMDERTSEMMQQVCVAINAFPAADVQEVRHGRWVMDENPHDGDCRCSVCTIAIDQMHERNHGLLNALTGGKWWTFYRYCPNCGSRMDLEGDTE